MYNVSSIGQDAHEFIIRRAQQGTTVYFSSPSREAIVKAIRSAKGRLKDTPIPLAERFSRFSNIPATLLHIGMLTVDFNDEELRAAGYELLGAVCTYLNFDKSPIVAAKCTYMCFKHPTGTDPLRSGLRSWRSNDVYPTAERVAVGVCATANSRLHLGDFGGNDWDREEQYFAAHQLCPVHESVDQELYAFRQPDGPAI